MSLDDVYQGSSRIYRINYFLFLNLSIASPGIKPGMVEIGVFIFKSANMRHNFSKEKLK